MPEPIPDEPTDPKHSRSTNSAIKKLEGNLARLKMSHATALAKAQAKLDERYLGEIIAVEKALAALRGV
jgi:hypothetical protein